MIMTPYHFSHSEDIKSEAALAVMPGTAQKQSIRKVIRGMTPYHLSLMKSDKGFTLLLASLIASIVLAIGISIFSIAHKQLILSSIGRDSQFAFYAADTGAECALFWDLQFGYFAPSHEQDDNITCDRQYWTQRGGIGRGTSYAPGYTMTFQFQPSDDATCVNVSVTKSAVNDQSPVQTVIHADGFSVPCSSIGTNARALQRSVELNY